MSEFVERNNKMKTKLTAMVLVLGAMLGAWASTVNLSALTADYVAKDGDTLTGKLGGGYRLSIADGATVTLNGVTIAVRAEDAPYSPPQWPGINCEGNATIVLAGDGSAVNRVAGGNRWPGIYVPESKTLVISGPGTLVVTGGVYGAGIGGADVADPDSPTGLRNCGNIVIEGGLVTAQGGDYAAGIGTGYCGHSGNVTISGGKVIATGGCTAPGIGGGYSQPEYSKCGNITISGGIVVATCGETTEMNGGAAGIGGGSAGGCGKIEITGGSVTATGYIDSAGIGGGHYQYAGCGDIVISGGSVTATGGTKGAGIGSGYNGNCGAITIENTVTKVVATKGEEAIDSIGKGWNSSTCGEVTVGDGLEDTTHGNTRTIFGEEPVVKFEAGAVSSSESKTVKLTVYGGSLTGPSSVKVFMTYQTAAAADLDFANATVNGVKVKGGLKFPLTLAWDTGDVTPYVIEIPLKGDKQVEDDETLTFQLADVIGTEMGETDVCTVTVEDPAFDELRGRIETGTATKAESNNWIKVSHDGIPYMCGLPYPADGGKVTGSGYCPAGKKVTLKAAANKGFAFVGWLEGSAAIDGNREPPTAIEYIATTPTLVIDRTTKPAKDTKTSTTISNLTESTTFYAVFEGDPRVTVTPVAFTAEGGVVASEGGKVTGAGRYAPGKKVTLKATANKGYVFGGWYKIVNSEEGIGNSEQGIGNSDEDGLISQAVSFSFEMGEEDIDLYARFVTTGEDAGSIVASLNGAAMPSPSDGSPAITTNVWAGVYLEWPLASKALSATTIKVAGLPPGLKFTAKPVTSKVGTGKNAVLVTNVPANTIYGAPTAASKTKTDKKTGVTTMTPSAVKVTVTTAGKSSATYEIALTVDPIAPSAVGTYNGLVGRYRDVAYGETLCAVGMITLTAGANGKISAKATLPSGAVSFSASRWDSFTDGVYAVEMSAKSGEVLAVALDSDRDWWVARVDAPSALTVPGKEPYSVVAWRNEHGAGGQIAADKNARDLIARLPLSSKLKEYYTLDGAGDAGYYVFGYGNNNPGARNQLELLAGANGTIKYSGKLEGKSFSGSAVLNVFDEGYRHWEWSWVNECIMGDFVVFPSKTEAVHCVIRFGPNTEGLFRSVNYTAE